MNVCVCLQTGMLMGPRSGGKFSIIKLMDNKFKSHIGIRNLMDSKWTINWTLFET